MRIASRFVTLVLLSLVATAARGQSAMLVGSVFRDSAKKTIAGAEVSIPDLELSTRTTDAGTFRLMNIMPGTYFVVARQIGYDPVSVYLTFADSQLVRANFLLVPHVVLLDTVVATGKRAFGLMRGFEERRATGLGHFITRDDLEKRQSWRMSEVIGQLPGASILRTGAGRAYVSSSHPSTSLGPGGRTSVCLAVVYLDGVKVYAGRRGEPPFDINSVQAIELEGVEYYAGGAEAPAQFGGLDASCGVLLMWTRISP